MLLEEAISSVMLLLLMLKLFISDVCTLLIAYLYNVDTSLALNARGSINTSPTWPCKECVDLRLCTSYTTVPTYSALI